jgi:hypothetical protein
MREFKMRKFKQWALPAVLLVVAMQAQASLYCEDSSTPMTMQWDRTPHGDVFAYTVNGEPSESPGPILNQYDQVFCEADGVELAYVQKNLLVTTTLKSSLQPNSSDAVYWTGTDAIFIVNNL